MEAMEELSELAESMRQAASLLADDDPSDAAAPRRPTTFLNAVALGNVSSGKSAVLNSLIGHPVLPTGENGATRAPIVVDLQRDPGLSSKSIVLQIDSKSQQVSASALRHSLQDRLSKGTSGGSGRGRADEIYLKLRTSTAPSLKLIDLPGIDQRAVDDSMINEYAGHNDAILLVVIPAMQAADVASSRALRLAKDIDSDGTRTVGVISKVDQADGDAKVHRVLLDIVNASANATPGLGRYPPFKREVVAIASNALDTFKNDAKKMVVALVDMERAFVPPQHFIRLVQRRMERQRREDELRNRSSKKTQEAEQSTSKRAFSPQTDAEQGGGSLKSMKDKSGQQDKDAKEGSNLQVAGPAGEITAGYLLKKSAKTNGWSKRWFVLNEKSGKLGYTEKQEERHFRGVITLEECNLEEVEEEEPSKSSKDSKKANGSEKPPSLVFKITNRVAYKTVLKAHSAVLLKAESMPDKVEWVNKIKAVIQSKGGSFKGPSTEGGSMKQSNSDGALDAMARRPADPEEELRWMSQEVRGYVEAVLNSLAANVPKAIVLCQVEKAKEDMLNQLYSSISGQSNAKIEELLQEDHNAKRRREKYQKQSSLLSKLTRQLSIHDNRASVSSYSNDSTEVESPRTPSRSGEDWRSAFDSSSNGPVATSTNSESRSRSADGRSRRYENGDVSSGANSGSRRTPNRLPPAPPKY
ncbi:Dynamin-2A [Zea mays]|uniref:Dynamin-2A n=1 Tax=Zea mays TaxID=4577 RepID=A0A1D6NRA2_MAIZE|nr:Dynamin-2A [Zea mays]AQL00836.1 Dynamin-2A [Zea mays]